MTTKFILFKSLKGNPVLVNVNSIGNAYQCAKNEKGEFITIIQNIKDIVMVNYTCEEVGEMIHLAFYYSGDVVLKAENLIDEARNNIKNTKGIKNE